MNILFITSDPKMIEALTLTGIALLCSLATVITGIKFFNSNLSRECLGLKRIFFTVTVFLPLIALTFAGIGCLIMSLFYPSPDKIIGGTFLLCICAISWAIYFMIESIGLDTEE